MSKLLLITDEVPQDYTQHIPLVLQHWERPFWKIYGCIRLEAKAAGALPRPPNDLTFHTGIFAFERYQIVIEYDNIGAALRMFFPDVQTELLMYLKANFG